MTDGSGRASDLSTDDMNLTVLALGASAGGLAAFEAFFAELGRLRAAAPNVAADAAPPTCFVLLQHLAPDHDSLLVELVQRRTSLPVRAAEDGMQLQADAVYVLPPDREMVCEGGHLRLHEPAQARGHRMPIDVFFSSLARDQGTQAVAVVLSGTGGDGSSGLRAVHEAGGRCAVQSPESSAFDGMPRSALAAVPGALQGSPQALARQLLEPASAPAVAPEPALALLAQSAPASLPAWRGEIETLQRIFGLLRQHTGHDFAHYKPSTVHRRIERRMAAQQIESLAAYARLLQQSPSEVNALFRDLLIGVTSFFRDPAAFEALSAQLLRALKAHRVEGAPFRVWVAGCSSGEEAYSVAMLLLEHRQALGCEFGLQVFASDLDSRAIAVARAGLYPAASLADMSPERRERFFMPEADGGAYRVRKPLRDLLIFSEHDINRDPPFSRLDVLSCRNLLIYMGLDLQRRLIPLFHQALNPGGLLFLGSSEGVGDGPHGFEVLDRKAKLFRRGDTLSPAARVSSNGPGFAPGTGPSATLGSRGSLLPSAGAAQNRSAPTLADAPRPAALAADVSSLVSPMKTSLRELTEQALLKQLSTVAALVTASGDLLYLHGRSGQFLEPAPGEVGVPNLLKMAREGLRHELSQCLRKAVASQQPAMAQGLRVGGLGAAAAGLGRVQLAVRPVSASRHAAAGGAAEVPVYLVVFDISMVEANDPASPERGDTTLPPQDLLARMAALEQELRSKDDFLQSTHEELEHSNEELKAANEELQSLNEELQSANEELETSKEELQSVNEELATVNTELHTKVADLSRANNDMNNLLAGTGIGTVFVDHQLRILRFTPAATQFINLIPGDIGRPVGHLVSNLRDYDGLLRDVQAVLDRLVSQETEVQTTEGKWCLMRIQPYRTLENVIEGAVISFVDITEMVRIREQLHQAQHQLRLAVVLRDASDAITVQDLEGRILAWNPGAERLYGWSEAEALRMNARDRLPPGQPPLEPAQTWAAHSPPGPLQPQQGERLCKSGERIAVDIITSPLFNEAGQLYALATTERPRNSP